MIDLPSLPQVVQIAHDGDSLPLFLIHAADGGTEIYSPMSVLDGRRNVYVIEDALLSTPRPSAQVSIEELAEDYLKQIQLIQPEGPYYLGGYSFGGLVAHAIVLLLVAKGERVGCLFLLEAHNPSVVLERRSLSQRVNAFLDSRDSSKIGSLFALCRRTIVGAMTRLEYEAVMRTANLVSSRPQTFLRRKWVQARNDEAFDAYVPLGVYTGICHMWVSQDKGDKFIPVEDLGWGHLLPNLQGRHLVPGNHLDFMNPSTMSGVAGDICDILEQPREPMPELVTLCSG